MTLGPNMSRLTRGLAVLLALAALFSPPSVRADEAKLETESYLIPSADPGISLYVRNKHPAGATSFAPDKILLYVHGATYPAETSFDLPLAGRSMMDYVAQHGWSMSAAMAARPSRRRWMRRPRTIGRLSTRRRRRVTSVRRSIIFCRSAASVRSI